MADACLRVRLCGARVFADVVCVFSRGVCCSSCVFCVCVLFLVCARFCWRGVRLARLCACVCLRVRVVGCTPLACVCVCGGLARCAGPPQCGVLWRFPTLPHPLGCSTIGAAGLSFQVRNVAGRFPGAVTTTRLCRPPPLLLARRCCAGGVGGGLVVVRIVVAASSFFRVRAPRPCPLPGWALLGRGPVRGFGGVGVVSAH